MENAKSPNQINKLPKVFPVIYKSRKTSSCKIKQLIREVAVIRFLWPSLMPLNYDSALQVLCSLSHLQCMKDCKAVLYLTYMHKRRAFVFAI